MVEETSESVSQGKQKMKRINILRYGRHAQDTLKNKRIVDRDTLLTYPDFNETFKARTNASAFQLGAVIRQKGKHIYFYIRKLTDAQMRYTVRDKELLSTVETLKKFRKYYLVRD